MNAGRTKPKTSRSGPDIPWWRRLWAWGFVARLTRILLRLSNGWRGDGDKNIPMTGSLIVIANHQSYIDPPIVGSHVGRNRPVAFLARATLFKRRFFGGLLASLSAVPVDQSGRGAKGMRTMIDELNAGGAVLLFPEGSRSDDGAVHEFKPGVLLLVRRTGADVLPAAIEGAYDAFPMGGKYRLGSKLRTRIGSVIKAETLTAMPSDEALELLRRTVETLRMEVRSELRSASKGRHPALSAGEHPYWTALPPASESEHLPTPEAEPERT